MFINLHCRVLLVLLVIIFVLFCCISLVYLLGHPSFLYSLHWLTMSNACLPSLSQFIPEQLTAEPTCSRYRTENKTYQHLIPKAASLSLLSTTIGPEHEPLLPNRVVNPQHQHSIGGGTDHTGEV